MCVALGFGVLQYRAWRLGFLVPRLARVLGLRGRVTLTVVVRFGSTVARSWHRTRKGRGPRGLGGGRMRAMVVVAWVRRMCILVS
jgi:hypothetical protein